MSILKLLVNVQNMLKSSISCTIHGNRKNILKCIAICLNQVVNSINFDLQIEIGCKDSDYRKASATDASCCMQRSLDYPLLQI